jgi:hypothetical protein
MFWLDSALSSSGSLGFTFCFFRGLGGISSLNFLVTLNCFFFPSFYPVAFAKFDFFLTLLILNLEPSSEFCSVCKIASEDAEGESIILLELSDLFLLPLFLFDSIFFDVTLETLIFSPLFSFSF